MAKAFLKSAPSRSAPVANVSRNPVPAVNGFQCIKLTAAIMALLMTYIVNLEENGFCQEDHFGILQMFILSYSKTTLNWYPITASSDEAN